MHDPSPCNILGKLRDCGLEGIGSFLSELSHELISPCIYATKRVRDVGGILGYGGGLVPKFSTPK